MITRQPRDYDLIDRHQRVVSTCPSWVIEEQVSGARSLLYLGELRRWREGRLYLRCPCHIVRHVAQQARSLHLRRNPDQAYVDDTRCDLCTTASQTWPNGHLPPAIYERRPIELLLRSTQSNLLTERRTPRIGTGPQTIGVRRARNLGTLRNIMHAAHWNLFGGGKPLEIAGWQQIESVLKEARFDRDTSDAYGCVAHYTYSPHVHWKGDIRELRRRARDEWPSRILRPECWIFGRIDSVEQDDGSYVVRIPRELLHVELRRRSRGEYTRPPLEFCVPEHATAVLGSRGPYLALVVLSLNDAGTWLEPRRLVLHAIASLECPIPVESQYERECALMLVKNQLSFRKPVVLESGSVLPDMVLLDKPLIIEVQGMDNPEYRTRKLDSHLRMQVAYPRHRILTYRANDGQSLGEFEKEIRQATRKIFE